MNTKKSNVTITDVAKEAGVAVGTVSKVINGHPVGPSYRQKVESAIRKLDYHVNNSAKALKSQRTRTIAFIIPNTITPFFALLTNYMNLSIERRGYKMMLCFTEYNHSREVEFIQLARKGIVDGIVALTYNPDLVIPEGFPFITIDRFFSESIPCVASDNFGGGRLAVKKLHELGCKHIACLRQGSSLANETNKRKDGFVAQSVEMGIKFEVANLGLESTMEDFKNFLLQFQEKGRITIDGIFCGSDLLAHKTRQMLQSIGYQVPEDIQIIGYDGVRMFGDHEYICSTIVQPVEEIAEIAINMLLTPDYKNLPQLITVPVQYAAGGTTLEAVEQLNFRL